MNEVKRDLIKLRGYRAELETLKTRLEDLERVHPKVSTYELARGGGANPKGLDSLLVLKEKTLEDFDALLSEYLCKYAKMSSLLTKHLEGLEFGVLELYYLRGLSWSEVSDQLHISQSWCFSLHRRALDKVVKCSL